MIRSSFGAILMQHCSHQILNSGSDTATFKAFILAPDLASFLILLIAGYFCRAVIGLISAFRFLAGEDELARSGRLAFTFTSIQREKDWCTAFLTGHTEIAPQIGLGPSGNVH